jgi:5-oxoprolinase (ATP-hydrolysing)
MKGSRRL